MTAARPAAAMLRWRGVIWGNTMLRLCSGGLPRGSTAGYGPSIRRASEHSLACHCGGRSLRDELVQDSPDVVDRECQMALLGVQVDTRVADVVGQPLAMGVRDHLVVGALPDMEWHVDGADVEAPIPAEGHVIVEPAPVPV